MLSPLNDETKLRKDSFGWGYFYYDVDSVWRRVDEHLSETSQQIEQPYNVRHLNQ